MGAAAGRKGGGAGPVRIRMIGMHGYIAQVTWSRDSQPFVDNRYSRRHLIKFDGGIN